MENILTGTAIGAGYLLNRDSKNSRTKENVENLFHEPSNQFTYSSNFYEKAKNKESELANRNFFNAKNAIQNNIIPPQFNNKIFNRDNLPKNTDNYEQNNPSVIVSPLTGVPISSKEFTHNNMVPFFGSRVRQNIDINKPNSTLSNHTGMENFTVNKREQKPLFEPTKDVNIQYGTQNQNNSIQSRINTTQYRRNELPFDKQHVGPGLNKGYSAKPTGGFHPDVRDYVLPKSIDELRPKSNPQISYKGRVIRGQSIVGKQTKVAEVAKNRPDTFYVQNADRYLTTTGAYLKETKRPCIIAKDTNRKHSRYFTPSAGPAVKKNETARSLYKKSTKNIYKKDSVRNAHRTGAWENEEFGDYGKSGIELPENERAITGQRTHTSNLTSLVKSIVAPLLDVMKTTKKENTIGNARQSGNMGGGNTKNVAWDPNDVARTTIKETNIHDNRSGNLGSNQKGVAYDPNDVARTTIKETNIHDNRSGNLESNQKGVAYDPNDVARTTIKETNIHDNRSGNLESNQRGVAYDPNDVARTTIKETNIHDNRSGNLGSNQKGVAYDPNDVARTTIKETNIHDTRHGNINTTMNQGGTVLDKKEMKFRTTIRETLKSEETTMNMKSRARGVAYDPNDVARTTIKETNIDNNHSGNLKGPIKLTSYDPNDVARTTIKETNIHDVRTGNVGGLNKDGAYITNEMEAPNTNRQFTSDHEYSGIADNNRTGLGYLTNEKEAPNTNRQFTSDHEYEGGANSMYKRPKTYSTAYNMRQNEVREGTLKGRSPTPQGTKVTNGKDKINMESKKLEGDYINTRDLASNKVYNSIGEVKLCSVTAEKNQYDYKIMDERIDPDLLSAFNQNPYTKPLNSY